MKKKEEPRSGMPMLIIGAVFIGVLIVVWYWVGSSKTNTPAANSNANLTNTSTPTGMPANAPRGADPPNQAGSPTAAVTVEEFADFQCGSCASVHPALSEIKSIYGSRIHFIFRNFPLSIPAHDKSYDAAVAAEAAAMQGGANKFWEMQNLLFSNQQAWTSDPNYKTVWAEYAKRIGLDPDKFLDDMRGVFPKGRVDKDIERGRGLNISSTPTIYINGVSIPFTQMKVEALKQIIDAELLKAASGSQPAGNTTGAAPANPAQ
jgi:protein-disulfide isomerase